MSEQLLKRRSEQPRLTHKLERVSAPTLEWPKRLLVLVGVAIGGAVLGQLGSTLLPWMSRGPAGGGSTAAASALTRAGSQSERQVEIDALMGSHDFGAALLLIDEALARFPGDAQLQATRRRAEEELRNRFRYDMFERAATKRNYAAALALFDEITPESVYRRRAIDSLPPLRSRYLAEQLSAAQAAASIGQCAEARQFAARIQTLEPGHAGARSVLESCANDAAASRRP